MTFQFKTKPFEHQLRIFEESKDREFFAAFLEQGTGKSKLLADVAAYLFGQGKITALVIVSPSAVAPNWLINELPKHLACDYQAFLWQSRKAGTKKHARAAEAMLEPFATGELAVISLSYDALMTDKCLKFLRKFLAQNETLLVLDESARVKNPTAKRTQKVLAMGKLCAYRWVMSGTPVSNGPFDVYSQLRFLSEDIWDEYGCRSFHAFKTMFGVFRKCVRNDNGREFEILLNYRNLDLLAKIVDSVGARVLKDDVLDLPRKLYSTRYFEMAPQQAKLYTKLRDDFLIELAGDDQITAPLMITRMIRLQQIASGYVPVDDDGTSDETKMVIMDPNPRLAVVREIFEDLPHQALVWAKFTYDVDLLMELAQSMGITAVRYDGQVGPDDRIANLEKFESGEAKLFIAKPSCAGEGLTLVGAKTTIYYNNSFMLSSRLQSEDRNHRIGQTVNVNYIDIVALHTIDEKIVDALRQKLSYADQITGDSPKEWI